MQQACSKNKLILGETKLDANPFQWLFFHCDIKQK